MSPTDWKPRYTPQQMTRRLIRKIILGLVLGIALALFAAHSNGYGILIAPSEQVDAPPNGLAMVKCTYFTGTEKVINHVARRIKEGEDKASCPLYSHVGLSQLNGFAPSGNAPRDDLPGLGPNIQFDRTPGASAPVPAPPSSAVPPAEAPSAPAPSAPAPVSPPPANSPGP